MSEKQSFETFINRKNPRINVKIGRVALLFDHENTMLYEHSEEYKHFDHVYRVNDSGDSGNLIARSASEELYSKLLEHNFPRMYRQYPTEPDEEAILSLWDRELNNELEAMELGETE